MKSDIVYYPLCDSPVHGGEGSGIPTPLDAGSSFRPRYSASRRRVLLLVFGVIVLLVLTGLSAYSLGKKIGCGTMDSDWPSPLGDVDSVFHYHRPYAVRPSNDSNEHWDSLFPRGRGFVQHPSISPVPHGIAVYHQLHCLDAIRHGYWAAIDRIEPKHKAEPGHVRHCIDYLRQSLMCSVDTNLEPISESLGGVTGFESPRKCRDIVRLTAWAEQWRTHDQMGHA